MTTSLLLLSSLMAVGDPSRLAVIQQASDFTLISQEGKPLRLRDLRGKVLLVSFVFTTCNGSCPATTARLVQVQQRLAERGLGRGERVRLLTVTLDPARDTPAALVRYMKLYDADPAGWSFLTGSADEVAGVVKAWGLWTKPAPNGQLDHPSRVFLLDRRGQIREIYDLAFLRTPWVVEDVQTLLEERE